MAFAAILSICTIANAADYTVPPNITTTLAGTSISGIVFNSAEANSFTMDSGTFAVTNTGNGNALLIEATAGATTPIINISGGTLSLNEQNTGGGTWIKSLAAGTGINISGGNFILWENGHDHNIGFWLSGTGSLLDISGGTFSVTQWYLATDVRDGSLFQLDGTANITVSGGNFQLDSNYPFANDINHNGTGTFLLSCATYSTNGINIDSNGYITDLTGTVSGTFRDGNSFSFTFDRASTNANIKLEIAPGTVSAIMLH